jgi:hypothetical protein
MQTVDRIAKAIELVRPNSVWSLEGEDPSNIVFHDSTAAISSSEWTTAYSQAPDAYTADHERMVRDTLLEEADNLSTADKWNSYTQTQKNLVNTYKQALRDVTEQTGWPTNVTWPTEPALGTIDYSTSTAVEASDLNAYYTKTESDAKYVGARPAFSSNPYALGTRSKGSSFSSSVPNVINIDNRTLSYSVSVGSLPSGLSLNSSTGVISGSISASVANGTTTFTIRVSNNAGYSDVSGSVNAQPPAPVSNPIGETRAYAGNGMGTATRYTQNSYTSGSPVKSFDWKHYYAGRYWSSGTLYYSLDGSNWVTVHNTGSPGDGSWGWTTRTGTINIPSNTSNTIWIRTRAGRPNRDANSAYFDARGYMTQARFV